MKTDFSDKFLLTIKHGFKVYPVFKIISKTNTFAVRVEDINNFVFENKTTTGEYKHTSKTINKAIEDTVCFIYEKLNKKK